MSVSWPVVSEPTQGVLTERQRVDYEAYKNQFINWLQNIGKDPQHVEGYSDGTVRQTSVRIDKFYRWVWQENGGYTLTVESSDAEDYIHHMVCSEEDYSNTYLSCYQNSIKRLFKWLSHERGESITWDSDFSFSYAASNVRDYLTVDEQRKIREAALEYGAIPCYTALTPEERDKWKIHLSYRFNMKKSDIGPDKSKHANRWKISSIIWTALDTGLRSIEVGRATVQWVDTENKVLRIPKEESSKNVDNWIVSITDRTAAALDRWLDERLQYDKYDGRDALWLTRDGNGYGSNSLRHIMSRLCDIAEIPTEGRQLTFYSIHHSVVIFMTREEDLKAAQTQLRHK